jgi:hypothetical protein
MIKFLGRNQRKKNLFLKKKKDKRNKRNNAAIHMKRNKRNAKNGGINLIKSKILLLIKLFILLMNE